MRMTFLVFCSLFPIMAVASPTLTVDGSCGSDASFMIEDGTPGGDLHILWGDRAGTETIPHGDCAGTDTSMRNVRMFATPWPADADGSYSRDLRLAPGFCGKSVQILDAETCELSDRVVLPSSSVVHLDCDYSTEFFNGSTCESHAELYNSGYAAGEADGYADGYWESYSSVDATYEEGYADAYASGYDEGATSVSLEGYYLAGFDLGYDDGMLDGTDIGIIEGGNAGFNHGGRDFYCDGEEPPDDDDGGSGGPVLVGGDLTDLYNSWESEGRTVYVFQSNPSVDIDTYDTFCEDRGMNWFVPTTADDAQLAITTLYEYDYNHTWVITKNNTTMGSTATWGGFTVTVDSPSCVDDSDDSFSGIRKWGCSMCDPEHDSGTTRCWDSGHLYDWLVCEADPIDFSGYAYWDQDVTTQSDADQDAAMGAACEETYPGSWAASISELASARSDAPDINTSGTFLTGTCPDCEGAASADAVDGHCRQCIGDGDHRPYGIYPPSVLWDDECCAGTQSTVCLSEPPCVDSDEDGVCDTEDVCPADPLDDSDGDGSCDSDDRCPDDPEDTCIPDSGWFFGHYDGMVIDVPDPGFGYHGTVSCTDTCEEYGLIAIGARWVCNLAGSGASEGCYTDDLIWSAEHCSEIYSIYDGYIPGDNPACGGEGQISDAVFGSSSEWYTYHAFECECG